MEFVHLVILKSMILLVMDARLAAAEIYNALLVRNSLKKMPQDVLFLAKIVHLMESVVLAIVKLMILLVMDVKIALARTYHVLLVRNIQNEIPEVALRLVKLAHQMDFAHQDILKF